MAQDEKIDQLNRKLDLIVRLLAYQLVAGMTVSHGAPILKRIGLTATEIAAVFDTTAQTVSVRLAESRRGKKERRSK